MICAVVGLRVALIWFNEEITGMERITGEVFSQDIS